MGVDYIQVSDDRV